MRAPDIGGSLRSLPGSYPTDVANRVAATAQAAGATDVVLYLIDFEHTQLLPLPTTGAHNELPVPESVPTTMAGRAFIEERVVSAARDSGHRVWVPIIEGSERTGVLALTLPGELDGVTTPWCEALGVLAGCEIAAQARYTDLYNLARRRKEMTLAASMQWDLLPPLTLRTPVVTSVGVLEPAYEVGGDCFDHAVNGLELDVAVMDAMGHGVRSSMVASLAVGTYRHARREGQPLAVLHERMEAAIADHFGGDMFATGQLARLALDTGELTWINAGHPGPLLVRDGKVVRTLVCAPSLPWGLGGELVEQASEMLEPGDAVLFYTDGVVEGRVPGGEPFGLDRLIEMVERSAASGLATAEIIRRVVAEVIAHQASRLRDDATLVMVSFDRGP
jgi:serine phosphatase RsbU (regulator of sigma subunit)